MVWLSVLILALRLVEGQEAETDGKNWAVLIAGSNGWGNYRHQADVCHAFHILHDIGKIPKSQIVVMMADDIANNSQNPLKGNIINYPNGPNVYPGVNLNYTGNTVTAENFKKVLLGLPTTKKDNIFVYFTDHGARGLVAMPFGDPLYADDFIKTLHKMNEKEMYNEMVIYVEACESGSMFDKKLADDLSIYATTASDDVHSSYAYFYDDKRGVYLADMYSIMWMQDSQANMTHGETLEAQYLNVKNETTQSTVEEFGDLSIQKEKVVNFQANGFFKPKGSSVEEEDVFFTDDFYRRTEGSADEDLNNAVEALNNKKSKKQKLHESEEHAKSCLRDPNFPDYFTPVSSWDAVLMTHKMRLKAALSGTHYFGSSKSIEQLQKAIDDEEAYRHAVDALFAKLVNKIVSADNRYPMLPTHLDWWYSMPLYADNYDCLRSTYRAYHNNCLRGFEDYSWKYIRVLSNICMIYDRKELSDIIVSSCDKKAE